jgi:hypothetical protein
MSFWSRGGSHKDQDSQVARLACGTKPPGPTWASSIQRPSSSHDLFLDLLPIKKTPWGVLEAGGGENTENTKHSQNQLRLKGERRQIQSPIKSPTSQHHHHCLQYEKRVVHPRPIVLWKYLDLSPSCSMIVFPCELPNMIMDTLCGGSRSYEMTCEI